MAPNEITWVIVSDGQEARLFEERARTGPLRPLPGLRAREDAGLRDEDEARFLRRVANCLSLAAYRGEFDRLVLIAPPKALRRLRAALPPGVAASVEASEPCERTAEDADSLRLRLRGLRAAA